MLLLLVTAELDPPARACPLPGKVTQPCHRSPFILHGAVCLVLRARHTSTSVPFPLSTLTCLPLLCLQTSNTPTLPSSEGKETDAVFFPPPNLQTPRGLLSPSPQRQRCSAPTPKPFTPLCPPPVSSPSPSLKGIVDHSHKQASIFPVPLIVKKGGAYPRFLICLQLPHLIFPAKLLQRLKNSSHHSHHHNSLPTHLRTLPCLSLC